ncbi:MAG: hypothetical protein DCC88_11580, partial [Spirobacillus cienkowskii]
MPQYPFIFIGSILAILSINIGCKSPDSSSKSRLQGKKNESLNQTPLENTLNIKLHNFPNIMAVNSKSGFFYAETERNTQGSTLQNNPEYKIRITDSSGATVQLLTMSEVPNSNPTLFYFTVPASFSHGKYTAIVYPKDSPNTQEYYHFEVGDEQKLDPTTIESMQIQSLQQFKLTDGFKIPPGQCIDLLVTAKTNINKTVYNVTNDNWYTKNDLVLTAGFGKWTGNENGFSLFTDDMKICAYSVDKTKGKKRDTKFLPGSNLTANFSISYNDVITSRVNFSTTVQTSTQENSVLKTNLSLDTDSNTSESEKLPPLEALVAEKELPIPEPLVPSEVVP